MVDIGYLQHGTSTAGPFRTESVMVRHDFADGGLCGLKVAGAGFISK